MFLELLKGFIVGICASVPLGPIGVLCIQRTLSKGRSSGFITGMGAAVTDTFFAAIALLSLSYVQHILSDYKYVVMIAGGLIVGVFGVRLFMTNPVKQIKRVKSGNKRYWQDFFSTILMTVSNPGAFFLMLGLFAFIGISHDGGEPMDRIASTLIGVFLGAALWWHTLTTLINQFRNKLRLRQLIMINRVAGIAILVLGIISIFDGIYRLILPYIQ
ncbi:MAG TPA: LysE family transporter [Candidatus Coprenecus stercoravium]|uniref:LysE family transporter n=1 Tax=Candidatus Coprenecus stercoravium TaxID=2840735 RepID=A0A9D2GRP7_9BACT|nr:LysE family transporter [Candidatus Coprenecus stercoravium]